MRIEKWIQHFARNGNDRPEPEWDAPPHPFGESEKALLLESIKQFQLGDGGGPAYLIGHDLERYFAKNPQMKTLVDLWFEEEKRHSELLGKAVTRLGGEPIEAHWSFSVFCGVRKFLGTRFELYALLLTEITSNNYYKLMRKYAGDIALTQMAELIIRDETGHIAFHRERIAGEMDGRYRLDLLWATKMRILAFAAGTMLWVNHRRAVVKLGATTGEFYRGFFAETSTLIETTRRKRFEEKTQTRNSSGLPDDADRSAVSMTAKARAASPGVMTVGGVSSRMQRAK